MQLGVQIPDFTTPGGPARLGADLATVARTADDAGFGFIAVMDHFFQIGSIGPTEREMLEAYTTLGYVAGLTSRVKLLTLVTGTVYRYPGILAKTVTTLDVLSGGRAWLGIGAAWNEEESRGLGIPFPPVAERFERLEETLQICLQMWRDDQSPFHGRHYQLERPINHPRAVSQPHPPIMIGGGGQRVLSLAGREADIVSISSVPFVARDSDGLEPQEVARRRTEFVRAAAGERFARLDVESSPYFTEITDDAETVLAGLAKSTGIEADLLRDHPNVLIGSSESVVESLHSRRESLGVNYVTVQQSQIESFAPVVALLHGR